ncbi:MAG TPA: efflux RND transporter periplasmic adaptor subunit [Pyrinomonadaceae bacterium]|nr:efflux RND transporter periplasmic adaptor subunit [Pyrinomonadaceae bacterium]
MSEREGPKAQSEPTAEEVAHQLEARAVRRKYLLIVTAVLAVLIVAVVAAWLFFRSNKSGAGRPVPAPRNISLEQPGVGTPAAPTETTLTLAPEMVDRAGIKIETVGEQLVEANTGSQTATGVVRDNAYRTTPVVSVVGGILRRVNVELGASVRRGQTLAMVFSNELAMAQSSYLTVLADLEEHHQHHRRTIRLLEIGAASREEFEQATTKLKRSEAEVASQRQKLLLLGLSQRQVSGLKSSSQISSEVSLPAPSTGTVIARAANPGEVVEANKEILRIADLSSVWVVGQVYEKDLGRIRIGSGASITAEAYPGRIFRGRVSYVDPTLDTATRTGQVRVELANPGQQLKIGMYVNIAFATVGGAESTAPTVPTAAVQNINNQQVVFVATKEPNVFVMRPVRLGPEVNGRYPVVEGLTVGDRIVTEGSFLLRAEYLKTASANHSH